MKKPDDVMCNDCEFKVPIHNGMFHCTKFDRQLGIIFLVPTEESIKTKKLIFDNVPMRPNICDNSSYA